MSLIPLLTLEQATPKYKRRADIFERGPTMKTIFFINRESHVRQLMKLAALMLLATPVFAQNYAITDLGTFGPNSNGNYSIAYCINNSGQVAGSSSRDFFTVTVNWSISVHLVANTASRAGSIPPARSPAIPPLPPVRIALSSTPADK